MLNRDFDKLTMRTKIKIWEPRQTQKTKSNLFDGEGEASNGDSNYEDEEESDPKNGAPCDGHGNAAVLKPTKILNVFLCG